MWVEERGDIFAPGSETVVLRRTARPKTACNKTVTEIWDLTMDRRRLTKLTQMTLMTFYSRARMLIHVLVGCDSVLLLLCSLQTPNFMSLDQSCSVQLAVHS